MANSNFVTYNGWTINQSTSEAAMHSEGTNKPYWIQIGLNIASGSSISGTSVLTASLVLDERLCPHFETLGNATRFIDKVGSVSFNPAVTASVVGGNSGSLLAQ